MNRHLINFSRTIISPATRARHAKVVRVQHDAGSHQLRRLSAHTSALVGIHDTIYALSTPPGRSAIAIIRISGPQSLDVLHSMLRPGRRVHEKQDIHSSAFKNECAPEILATKDDATKVVPRKAHYREIFHPLSGEMLDRCIVLWMPGPRTSTGENVVELHLHGSRAVIDGVMNAISAVATGSLTPGDPKHCAQQLRVRSADPGEFTRRALFHGVINLLEVEALSDLLNSDTSLQRKQALAQSSGRLTEVYEGWRQTLTKLVAHAEAMLDFGPEEQDIGDPIFDNVCKEVQLIRTDIANHLAESKQGEIIRNGLRIAIVGAPNSGKSSLMNSLARRDIVIVSPYAGTTRDVIETQLDLNGISTWLADTAGLHEAGTANPVEKIGMDRALEKYQSASMRIWMIDVHDLMQKKELPSEFYVLLQQLAGTGLSAAESLDSQKTSKSILTREHLETFLSSTLIVLNKIDTLEDLDAARDAEGKSEQSIQTLTGLLVSFYNSLPPHGEATSYRKDPPMNVPERTEANVDANKTNAIDIRQLVSAIPVSCKAQTGMDILLQSMEHKATSLIFGNHSPSISSVGDTPSQLPLLSRQRHFECAAKCVAALDNFLSIVSTFPRYSNQDTALDEYSQYDSWVKEGPKGLMKGFIAPTLNTPMFPYPHLEPRRANDQLLDDFDGEIDAFGWEFLPYDMAVEELRLAIRSISALTGVVDVEEILDVVFTDFCIGK